MWADCYSDTYRDKTVLVTGGAGAIGGNLVRKLAELSPKQVVVLDDLSSSYSWNIPRHPRISFVQGSILDDRMLTKIFNKKPEIVFHLAAHFANQNSVDNPEIDLEVNGRGILKVLEFSRQAGVSRFVYSSSGCGVYGAESKLPFEESDVSISLNTPYQVTKLLGELYTNYFRNLYNLSIVNARFFNSYGPGEVPGKYRNVIPNFFYWARKGLPLPITGTGKETRDFTYVGDIVNGLIAMGSEPRCVGEAINLGTSKETSVDELANRINNLTGNKAGIVFTKPRDWDKKTNLRASIDKAKRILGYQPTMRIEDGLQRVHEWFEENWGSISNSAEF